MVPRSRSCSPLLFYRVSDQLLSGALPCAAPSSMLEGGRRGLRAHLQAAAGAQGAAERLEPAVGRGAPGCALHFVAERRGSLWGRQGGGGLGGSKEERGGETGSAVPAEVEKGRAPHLSGNIG
ncbi:unnamed protein product [Coccothraustes coccothraustes]